MKEDQITGLGFKFDKEYTHDEWFTRRFTKDNLQVEFTYDKTSGKLVTYDIVIEEGYIVKPTLKTIALLSEINFVL